MPTNATLTNLGTPCARSWTQDWLATVNAKESELNHRICGARLPGATPCTNASGHPSGRCPFHGGFDLTGAPPGNRNATIHGLYTRRLRPCTPNCPHYQTCPLSSDLSPDLSPDLSSDLSSVALAKEEALAKEDPPTLANPTANQSPSPSPSPSTSSTSSTSSTPSPPPPTCPYQLTEYNTVLTDALAIVESQPHPNPMGIHTAHNVAMLQVLVNAATTHLAQASNPWSPSTSSTSSTPVHAAQDPNPSAIIAFTRLMRELRAHLRLLSAPAHPPLFRQKDNATPPSPDGILRHAQRTQHDTGLDPDSVVDAQIPPQTPQTHAKAYIQRATLAGGQGRDIEMCELFDEAARIDEAFAESERDHVLASYRPAKQSVSEELAKHILGNLHLPPLPATEDGPDATATGPEHALNEESDQVLQHFLDLFREGKMPPESFPIGSPLRAYAEFQRNELTNANTQAS